MKNEEYCEGMTGWDCRGDYRRNPFEPDPKYAHLDFSKYCKQCGKLIPSVEMVLERYKEKL